MSPWRGRESEGHLWPSWLLCGNSMLPSVSPLMATLFPQPKLSPFVWTPKVNHLHPHPPNPHSADPTPPPSPLSQRLCRKDAVVFAALAQGCSAGEVGTAFNTTQQSAGRRGKRHVRVACCKTVTCYMNGTLHVCMHENRDIR